MAINGKNGKSLESWIWDAACSIRGAKDAAKQQWRYSTLFAVGVVALCILGRELDQYAFQIYIVGSSFLHFIYDGWIWKIRQPDVGEPLGIQYAPAR